MQKRHIYEESIRVPLMMRGPGIPRGVTIPDLSINADLAPTIVDAANATPGLVMDGRSLIPVAQQPGIEQGRELLIEYEATPTAELQCDPHLALHVRRAQHRREELYDLRSDPFELQSRHNAPAYASVRSAARHPPPPAADCAGASCRAHP